MRRWTISRTIHAPVHRVFNTVADASQFSRAIPHIVSIEFLSELKFGLGTRFRETRLMNGKPVTTELEVTEFVPDSSIRLVANTHGTIWDTLFTVAATGKDAVLGMTMVARTDRLLSKVLNLLIHPMVFRAISRDMDAVKIFCET